MKVTQFVLLSQVSPLKFWENAQKVLYLIVDTNNDIIKIFKSDTFENYKSFVPVEVQNHI